MTETLNKPVNARTATSLSRLAYSGLSALLILLISGIPGKTLPVATSPNPESLTDIAKRTLEFHFEPQHFPQKNLSEFANSINVAPQWQKRAGLFVTLSIGGKSRACWGSLEPQYPDLVKAVVYTTAQALKNEYRYAPVKSNEWQRLKPQITIVNKLEPISGGLHAMASQNALKDGLFVRAGGRTGVLLPGEVCDGYYQLVKCKLKAGIKPKEQCQIWRIKADVIR